MKVKTIFIMLITLSMSVWLFISPSIKKQEVLEKQNSLIAQIENNTKPQFSTTKSVISDTEHDIEQKSFGDINFEEKVVPSVRNSEYFSLKNLI